MTKFTVICANNSDARDYARSLGRLNALSVSCRHNGGRKVIAVVAPESAGEVETLLENNPKVASFEMTDAC